MKFEDLQTQVYVTRSILISKSGVIKACFTSMESVSSVYLLTEKEARMGNVCLLVFAEEKDYALAYA